MPNTSAICLLFDPQKVGRADLVTEWARTRGIATFARSGLGLMFAWRRLARKFAIGVYMEHPVEAPADLQTLESFLTDVRKAPGQFYYAPRPNDHQDVPAATLAAAQPMRAASPNWLGILHALGRRFLASRVLPAAGKSVVRSAGRTIKSWARGEGGAVRSPNGISGGTLVPKLPANLIAWPGAWQPWKPDLVTLRRDLLERITRFFPHPQHLHVIALNKCNLRCVMCPYHSPRYAPQHTSGYFDARKAMDDSLFRKIVDYAGAHKISLQFGQIEEVLLHPRIFDYITMAKAAGVPHIHLTTNGTLLNAEKAEKLAATGIDSVMFSIDAATPETYRKVRGRDLEELEANIAGFLPLARERGIKVTVSFILQDEARDEREAFLEKWRKLGVDSVTYYVLSAFDPKTGEVMREGAIYEPGTRYPCASPWTQSVIFPDGEVSLCCKTMLDVGWRGVVSVGSLREHSMQEIWQGEAYQRVRGELIDNEFREFEVCKKCGIWSATSYFEERTPTYVRSYNETSDTIRFLETAVR